MLIHLVDSDFSSTISHALSGLPTIIKRKRARMFALRIRSRGNDPSARRSASNRISTDRLHRHTQPGKNSKRHSFVVGNDADFPTAKICRRDLSRGRANSPRRPCLLALQHRWPQFLPRIQQRLPAGVTGTRCNEFTSGVHDRLRA